jgi:ATP-dependent exoDNAse (exonuclease V) beta subunit
MQHPVVSAWVDRYFIDHSTAKTDLRGVVEFWNAQDRTPEAPAPPAMQVPPTDASTVDSANKDPGSKDPGSKDSRAKRTVQTDIDLDIADAIAQLHRRSDRITIGVLTRTNADVAKMISLLRDRGVEASQEGGNPLTDTAPVLVIQSALKLAEHPGDSLAYFHTIHSPLKSFWNQEALSDAASISTDLRDRLDTLGFGRTVSALVNHLAPFCTVRDQERLLQLVDEAYRFDAAKQTLVHEFVDRHSLAPGCIRELISIMCSV